MDFVRWAHPWMLSSMFHSTSLPYDVRGSPCDAAFAARVRAVVISMSTDKAISFSLNFSK